MREDDMRVKPRGKKPPEIVQVNGSTKVVVLGKLFALIRRIWKTQK